MEINKKCMKCYIFFCFFSSLVNFVFHVTLNSLLSTVVCANILLETMTTHITATNVVFAGKNLKQIKVAYTVPSYHR